MKDERGHYYTPSLQHPEVRMYVRENNDEIEFRLYNPKEPIIWEKHGWMPFGIIEAAAAQYKGQNEGRNPMALYDVDIAKKLLGTTE